MFLLRTTCEQRDNATGSTGRTESGGDSGYTGAYSLNCGNVSAREQKGLRFLCWVFAWSLEVLRHLSL